MLLCCEKQLVHLIRGLVTGINHRRLSLSNDIISPECTTCDSQVNVKQTYKATEKQGTETYLQMIFFYAVTGGWLWVPL